MISLVVPTVNNKDLTLVNIRTLDAYLARHFNKYEIVLVEDGSRPSEAVDPTDLPSSVFFIRLEKNCGKGQAVREGIAKTRGDCCLFTDIDLPYDLEAIPFVYELIVDKGLNAVVGDRTLTDSVALSWTSWFRRVASRLFSKFITLFIIGGIFDFQCGFKAFSGHLARDLFPLIKINGFGFDVEIFYLLLKNNIMIKKIPVRLRNATNSTVAPLRHGLQMILAAFKMMIDFKSGRYDVSRLKRLENVRYWEWPHLK
ncbi:MAG: glycosyltransferase [Candidatus Aminicenantales bacterium]